VQWNSAYVGYNKRPRNIVCLSYVIVNTLRKGDNKGNNNNNNNNDNNDNITVRYDIFT
jgi:hypothetical protein